MTNTEITQQIYTALNRNDIAAAIAHFDPNILRVEFEGSPSGGTYRGLADVEAHFSKGRDSWAEGSCTPEQFVVAGDKVIVFVYVRVRLKNNQEWNEGRVADVWSFRNGKVIEFRSFFDKQHALEWAGA